ncbi:MAG TPA: alpha/beta-type small acid-soluble spore protein [Limnochordales bacterium]
MTQSQGPKARRWRRPKDNPLPSPLQAEPDARSQPLQAARESLKEEVARELGLQDDLADPDRLSVREAGKIGGQMVRRLIREGQRRLAEPPPRSR